MKLAMTASAMISPESPIFILTGAGVSRESGLHTFRDPDGVWARHRIEDVATPDAFARDPGRVHAFYNARRRQLDDPAIQPNAAHHALARLERAWPAPVTVVTQNVDDLHERAGQKSLIHMHGELAKIRCDVCHEVTPHRGDLGVADICGACGRAGRLRPHVVWFGEMPLEMERIAALLQDCELFVSIGTSGAVYPAAGFAAEARAAGAYCLELNLEATGAGVFHESRGGVATALAPAFVDELLARL